MTNVKGIAASSGYAIAKAYKLDMPDLTVTRTTVEDTEAEIALYNKSVAAVKLEIAAIKEAATKNLSEEDYSCEDMYFAYITLGKNFDLQKEKILKNS